MNTVKDKIYRITNKQQFIQLIKDNTLSRIITNGADVLLGNTSLPATTRFVGCFQK